jgi:GNAT superfamily N-acetyltransferase
MKITSIPQNKSRKHIFKIEKIGTGIVWTYEDDNIAQITSLFVEPQYRGQKWGIYILNSIAKFLIENNIKFVRVDDMSDNSRNKQHNIYIQSGFKYKFAYGPEMEGNTSNIANITDKLLQ